MEHVAGPGTQWKLAHRKIWPPCCRGTKRVCGPWMASSPEHAADDTRHAGIEDLSLKTISEDSSPVVKLVRSTLYDALKAGADIHIETDARGLTIKYRIDGVLSAVGSLAGQEQAEQVISRIKVMSELDIAERRVPQDGRFKVRCRGARWTARLHHAQCVRRGCGAADSGPAGRER